MVCWGQDANGESTPPEDTLFLSVSSGQSHTCGLTNDRNAVCWGLDAEGQATPPADTKFFSVVSGRLHSCGINFNKEVECWGCGNGGGC